MYATNFAFILIPYFYFQDAIITDNQTFQDELDEEIRKLRTCHFPENEPFLKFKIISDLLPEQIIDYCLLYGDDIDSLRVQTFISASKSKMNSAALISVLVDAMAAFCRLRSPSDLYSIDYFKGTLNPQYKTFLCTPNCFIWN